MDARHPVIIQSRYHKSSHQTPMANPLLRHSLSTRFVCEPRSWLHRTTELGLGPNHPSNIQTETAVIDRQFCRRQLKTSKLFAAGPWHHKEARSARRGGLQALENLRQRARFQTTEPSTKWSPLPLAVCRYSSVEPLPGPVEMQIDRLSCIEFGAAHHRG